MAGFWNKKTPTVSVILAGIVDASLFVAVSDNSRFGYWKAIILLVAILLSVPASQSSSAANFLREVCLALKACVRSRTINGARPSGEVISWDKSR